MLFKCQVVMWFLDLESKEGDAFLIPKGTKELYESLLRGVFFLHQTLVA